MIAAEKKIRLGDRVPIAYLGIHGEHYYRRENFPRMWMRIGEDEHLSVRFDQNGYPEPVSDAMECDLEEIVTVAKIDNM